MHQFDPTGVPSRRVKPSSPRPTESIFNFHPCVADAVSSCTVFARVFFARVQAAPSVEVASRLASSRRVAPRHVRTYVYLARHISRHINILYSALYRKDKKHVCSSAYQMLSPSLFVCQLNATSASTENPSASRRHTALLSYSKPPKPTPSNERSNLPPSALLLVWFSYAFLSRFLPTFSYFLFSLFSFRISSYIPRNLFSRPILRRALRVLAGSSSFRSSQDNGEASH